MIDNPTPTIRVAVDPTNPGQFFACCGLLELADRLWPGAEGWFSEKGREFCIECKGTAEELLETIASCELTNTMTEQQKARLLELHQLKSRSKDLEDEKKDLESLVREAPIRLHRPFDWTIDWFTDDRAGGSRFKTWAGRQSVIDIATAMKKAIETPAFRRQSPDKWLAYSVTECGLPFNFDSEIGGQGSAIDVGFSFDPLSGNAATRIESSARPFLELLAFVGLQRFRPRPIEKENRYLYCVWDRPLAIEVAAPAACGMLPLPTAPLLEFRLLYRTKYLKSFLPAIPFNRGSDE